ncbi:mariner transposase [Trichonephila inaurata madagascariensis]|uniref:Mariner transposase n=1 Tax=Trichonephila inaurata madagascariensis TaxID=2747483 RepID=A0A8X7BYC4_9ARAC|nr:mariner transposase [Trichonephila inaurata madagascariensis]
MLHMSEGIQQKWLHLDKKNVLFPEDNAHSHKSVIAISKIKELKFELLPHASCSPDLAPPVHFLFPILKKGLRGQRFSNDEEVMSSANSFFEDQDSSY